MSQQRQRQRQILHYRDKTIYEQIPTRPGAISSVNQRQKTQYLNPKPKLYTRTKFSSSIRTQRQRHQDKSFFNLPRDKQNSSTLTLIQDTCLKTCLETIDISKTKTSTCPQTTTPSHAAGVSALHYKIQAKTTSHILVQNKSRDIKSTTRKQTYGIIYQHSNASPISKT